MKRILAILDASHFPDTELRSFHYMAGLSGGELTEIFLEDIVAGSNNGIPVATVVTESRFAALLLINQQTSFAELASSQPPEFVKDTLTEAECPVMIVPENTAPVNEIIFTYNGTHSSMYAIRQFTQLFPSLSDIPAQVVYVIENGNGEIPDKKLLTAYMEQHYRHVSYTVMEGEPAPALLGLLLHSMHGRLWTKQSLPFLPSQSCRQYPADV